ncbi:MAG: DUF1816 domain-containing protein [Microcystaceae cyanobacterium]
MDQANQSNPDTYPNNNGRSFLYEVVFSSSSQAKSSQRSNRQAKKIFKVPYERMAQEMKRIARLGGTIVNITPVIDLEQDQGKTVDLPWWLEISTTTPRCIYYFGPFDSQAEAQAEQGGYIEDLEAEGATEIKVTIKQTQPTTFTEELE